MGLIALFDSGVGGLSVAREIRRTLPAEDMLYVVACNTATGAALEDLRAAVTVPVVGLEPAVKIAARVTRTRRVGVMATTSTVRSERLARLIRSHADGIEVLKVPCPGLADLVEEGHLEDATLDRR